MSAAVGCLGSATVRVSEVTSVTDAGLGEGSPVGMMPTKPLLTDPIFCFSSLWCLWMPTPPADKGRGRLETTPLEADPAEARRRLPIFIGTTAAAFCASDTC